MAEKKNVEVRIKAPNIQPALYLIRGTTPYVQCKMSKRAINAMRATQELGSTINKKNNKKEPKDFERLFYEATRRSPEGWCGIPAPAFRNGMIDACRLVGFKMTHAKLSVFAIADGFDIDDGMPLVKITKGEPEMHISKVTIGNNTTDLRVRPMWREGWEAVLLLNYDTDMFTLEDVTNLLVRVGRQVGIGEGRYYSKKSPGIGWGLFEVTKTEEKDER